ncbi:hypothetical protein AAVH_01488 [Aphelenchoides avenae]|nr:hypothetical protein AAVH_01488 [Aphelenchus avenae]
MKWTLVFAFLCLLAIVVAASETNTDTRVARPATAVAKRPPGKPNSKFDRAARRRKTGGKRRRGKGAKKLKKGRRG